MPVRYAVMDWEKLWRKVTNTFADLERDAPEGYAPVIELFLAGRSEPICPEHVQTSSDPNFTWTFLAFRAGGDEDESFSPDVRLIAVPDHYIERIEMHYERSVGQPIGFTYGELEDAPPPSSSA